MRRLVYALPLLAFAAIAAWFLIGLGKDPSKLPSALIDKPVPQFALPALEGGNGKGLATEDLRGRVALVNFFASWCGPCKESYPGLNRLRERFGSRGFRVVLATQLYGYFQAERNLDAAAEVDRDRTYFAEHHLNVPIAIGERMTASMKNNVMVYSPAKNPNDEAYKVGGIPQIHLIDRQGRIRLIMVGYDDANEPKLATLIEQLLSERRP